MQKIQEETDAAASLEAASSGPPPAEVKEQSTDPVAAAGTGAATAATAAAGAAVLRQSPSSSSLTSSRVPAPATATGGSSRSGSGMIPLAVAQEAAARQQQWLDQLQRQLEAPDLAVQAALESERALRREQDVEYQQVGVWNCIGFVFGLFRLWQEEGTIPASSQTNS